MMNSVFRAAACAALFVVYASGAMAQALPPAVGKPLAQARALLASHRFAQAMAQVNVAAAHATNENERFVVEEMRASVAQQAGDTATAARTFADLLASGKVPPSEQVKLIQAEVGIAYQQKNFANEIMWLNRYFKAGGESPEMRSLMISAYYQNKDYANAAKLQAAQIAAEVKARRVPPEQQLDLLAAADRASGDSAGFKTAMINLVYYYPKPDYWLNLISMVETRSGFSDRLTLDLDRFKMAIGLITKPAEYMEMAELALQVPLPGEAKTIVDKGYAAGVLGTGPEAPREKRLADLVAKTYASEQPVLAKKEAAAQGEHDGNPLVTLGEEYCSYGQYDKGISLIQAGQAKGDLRHPEDTKLHLGVYTMLAGKKAEAIKIFRGVGGTEGAADVAQLWVLLLNRA
jgi:hypothetical protein